MKFHTVQLSPPSYYFVPHRTKYMFQHLTPGQPQPVFFLYVRNKVSTLYRTATALQPNILIFTSFRQWTERQKF